jgi:hypothetical protein
MLYRFFVLLMLCPPGAFARPGGQVDPLTLHTRDQHQELLVVADPYLSADRYKGPFGKKSPYEAGIVAINVYFRNDNDSPIRLNRETIRLVVSQPGTERQRLAPLSPADVADRALLHADLNQPVPRRPLPIPSSGSKSGRSKAWNEMVNSLGSVVLADVIPPHTTTHGFLFFDVNHNFDAIRHSRVYIPDLSFTKDHSALFFFEIDLGIVPAN